MGDMAQAQTQRIDGRGFQLGLYGDGERPGRQAVRRVSQPRLCAGCRASEARYGFRPEGADAPEAGRPRTLCFECFRVEVQRRQAVAARMARGWNATQVRLPLEERLRQLERSRRRAQIAARHALGLT